MSESKGRATESSARASPVGRIAFQGEPGANSQIAANEMFPSLEPLPCPTFEDALGRVKSGEARLAMIPIENSVAGRVADIHHLLPNAGLYIVGEHFLRVRHQLMALPGVTLERVKRAISHTQALGQCRNTLRALGIEPMPAADTAGSARLVAEQKDPSLAAIASDLAAQIYGLEVLKRDIEDEDHNTTRFVILASEPDESDPGDRPIVTTFIFNVRNVPAALYKALGGFATNGINMTKLESYQLDGSFSATMFYSDIEGHPRDKGVRLALEELSFFSTKVRILGSYPASPLRRVMAESGQD
jgi:prephenate dehydratase